MNQSSFRLAWKETDGLDGKTVKEGKTGVDEISWKIVKEVDYDFFEEDGHFFDSFVSQSVKFIEAESEGQYIGDYAKGSKVHIQVKKLARKVVEFFGDK